MKQTSFNMSVNDQVRLDKIMASQNWSMVDAIRASIRLMYLVITKRAKLVNSDGVPIELIP